MCVFFIKNVQQKFEGMMIGSIYIVGLSVSLNGSDFTTGRETDKKYIFASFILIFFLNKREKNQWYLLSWII